MAGRQGRGRGGRDLPFSISEATSRTALMPCHGQESERVALRGGSISGLST